MICVDCGSDNHNARRLCKTCYARHWHVGDLDRFPSARVIGPAGGRIEDFAELRSLGRSVVEAADRVGVSERTGWRYESKRKRR